MTPKRYFRPTTYEWVPSPMEDSEPEGPCCDRTDEHEHEMVAIIQAMTITCGPARDEIRRSRQLYRRKQLARRRRNR